MLVLVLLLVRPTPAFAAFFPPSVAPCCEHAHDGLLGRLVYELDFCLDADEAP